MKLIAILLATVATFVTPGLTGSRLGVDIVPKVLAASLATCSVAPLTGPHWIESVAMSDRADIYIVFTMPMRSETLNPATVTVISEKQGRDVTSAFGFYYDERKRTLTLHPLNPKFNFGTGNLVTVQLSSTIENAAGRMMGTEFRCSITT